MSSKISCWKPRLNPRWFFVLLAACFASGFLKAQTCENAPDGLVSWWKGEDDTSDAIGNNDGTAMNGVSFETAEVGKGFIFDGTTGYLQVPASGGINLGAGDGFTLELWLNPGDLSRGQMIAEWNDGAGHIGAQLAISIPQYGGLGSIFANLLDTQGYDHTFASQANVLTLGAFQHVALTFDKQSGLGALYLNGALVASKNLGNFTPQTSYALNFGSRISGNGAGMFLSGVLDEITLYNRALSGAEISAIFSAGSDGKCRPDPEILAQPASTSAEEGYAAAFQVQAKGARLTYQWSLEGNPLPGATDSTLIIDSVRLADAGAYSVTVSNAFGSIQSSNAVLTVLEDCLAPAPGVVAWWGAESNLLDSVGGNIGMAHGGLSFDPGEEGSGFEFNGSNAYVTIAQSTSLDIGAGDGLTIECWINPEDVSSAHSLAEWADGSGSFGVQFWTSIPGLGGSGSLFANLKDISNTDHIIRSPPGLITTGGFQHVAVAYDRASGVMKLYRNGIIVASSTQGTFQPRTSLPLSFGARTTGGISSLFRGKMDEITFYNRALSDAEIQSIYFSGMAGKACSAPEIQVQPAPTRGYAGDSVTFTAGVKGSSPLSFQWRFNSADIVGATNSVLILTNIDSSEAGDYSLAVTNEFGEDVSSNGVLKVDVVKVFVNGQLITNDSVSAAGSAVVQLSNVYTNGLVFYTLDGSEPTFTSTQYSGPFEVDRTVTLRVLGYSADFSQAGESGPVLVSIVPVFTLTLTNSGGGTVLENPSKPNYASNTVVNLTANPASGWRFLQWIGDVTGTNRNEMVTLNRNKFVGAVFGTALGTTISGNGSIVLNPPGGEYVYGSVVTISAIPQPGSSFAIWGNAASGNANPLRFMVTNANPIISSLFSSVPSGQASIAVVPTGDGQVTVSPRANTYALGTALTITAIPSAGQSFVGWSGDANGSANPLTITASANKVIYANFSQNPRMSVEQTYEGFTDSGFSLSIFGDPGLNYELDASSNLLDWTPVSSFSNSVGVFQYIDSGATTDRQRFYRVIQWP